MIVFGRVTQNEMKDFYTKGYGVFFMLDKSDFVTFMFWNPYKKNAPTLFHLSTLADIERNLWNINFTQTRDIYRGTICKWIVDNKNARKTVWWKLGYQSVSVECRIMKMHIACALCTGDKTWMQFCSSDSWHYGINWFI